MAGAAPSAIVSRDLPCAKAIDMPTTARRLLFVPMAVSVLVACGRPTAPEPSRNIPLILERSHRRFAEDSIMFPDSLVLASGGLRLSLMTQADILTGIKLSIPTSNSSTSCAPI